MESGFSLSPDAPIAVDKFRHVPGTHHFFLSHLHGDHIDGLKSSWNYGIIYCSEITKRLLHDKFDISDNLVVAIETDNPTIIYLDANQKVPITVTLIDAMHCPGSVMFLFEGYFGIILHTGDFRFHKSMLENSAFNGKTIDKIFMDNTYANESYDFPTRDDAIRMIIEKVEEFPMHDVIVGIDSLGKEEILVALAHRFETLVVVSEQRYRHVNLIGLDNIFTTDRKLGRIHVFPKNKVTNTFIRNWGCDAIGIVPSGWALDRKNSNILFHIPYSLHSSYTELESFISGLKPRRISPIVSSTHSNMSYFGGYLNKTPRPTFEKPDFLAAPIPVALRGKRNVFREERRRIRVYRRGLKVPISSDESQPPVLLVPDTPEEEPSPFVKAPTLAKAKRVFRPLLPVQISRKLPKTITNNSPVKAKKKKPVVIGDRTKIAKRSRPIDPITRPLSTDRNTRLALEIFSEEELKKIRNGK